MAVSSNKLKALAVQFITSRLPPKSLHELIHDFGERQREFRCDLDREGTCKMFADV